MSIRVWSVVGVVVALMVALGTPVASQAAAPRSTIVISDVGAAASADGSGPGGAVVTGRPPR